MSETPQQPDPQQPQYPPPGQYQQPQYQQPQYPPQYPQGGGQPYVPAPISDADRRLWAMLAHIGGIFIGFVAPLIVWLVYKDRDQFVKEQSVEALNFQITVAIGYVISTVLFFVLIGFLLIFVVIIASLVFSIIGGLAANRGENYRYPFALRLIS